MKLIIRYVETRGVGKEIHEVIFDGERASIGRGTDQEIQIRKPIPRSAATNSAATIIRSETPSESRKPVKIDGRLAGRMTFINNFQPVAP